MEHGDSEIGAMLLMLTDERVEFIKDENTFEYILLTITNKIFARNEHGPVLNRIHSVCFAVHTILMHVALV
jgi:hypothetical protein